MERYERIIKELFTRHPSFQAVGKEAYHPGLEGMLVMDGLMGHPHRSYKCIHVAGTNGKGSVCHMLAAALAAQGHKVGLYTSPHLLDFRERIRVVSLEEGFSTGAAASKTASFRLMDKEAVLAFCDRWQGDYDRIGLSFFEITTLMAFDWFARCGVDYAVIETGLGGRMDSTNIIRPKLSVITSIGLDHCDILGNTLAEIAFEKAGIIKPHVPVVIGEGGPEINPVFEKKVLYTNLPEPGFGGDKVQIMNLLHYAEKEPVPEMGDSSSDGQDAAFERLLGEMDLPGAYQRTNLRTVLCALRVLGVETGQPVRYALTHAAALTGLRGRWERLQKSPEVIGDIGHNAHGLRWNFATLQKELDKGRRVWILYGSVSDKDVAAAVALLPAGADLMLSAADNPRALRPEKIRELIAPERFRSCRLAPTVAEAVERVLADAAPEDLVYIGGSSYLVAEALQAHHFYNS